MKRVAKAFVFPISSFFYHIYLFCTIVVPLFICAVEQRAAFFLFFFHLHHTAFIKYVVECTLENRYQLSCNTIEDELLQTNYCLNVSHTL